MYRPDQAGSLRPESKLNQPPPLAAGAAEQRQWKQAFDRRDGPKPPPQITDAMLGKYQGNRAFFDQPTHPAAETYQAQTQAERSLQAAIDSSNTGYRPYIPDYQKNPPELRPNNQIEEMNARFPKSPSLLQRGWSGLKSTFDKLFG